MVFVATRVVRGGARSHFTAISVAALCLGSALLAILRRSPHAQGVLLVVVGLSAYVVDAHAGLVVVLANRTGITMARVSPWRYRLKATVVDDRPPAGASTSCFRARDQSWEVRISVSDRPGLYFERHQGRRQASDGSPDGSVVRLRRWGFRPVSHAFPVVADAIGAHPLGILLHAVRFGDPHRCGSNVSLRHMAA